MNEQIDEQAWLEEIATGGRNARKALKPLYFRYANRFRQYFQRRGLSHADAEDLCQESFIKIVRSAPAAGQFTAPRAWLWSVAKTVLLDYLRSRGLEPKAATWHGDALSEPGEQEEQAGLARCVEGRFREFAENAPEAAQVVKWAVLEGFSAREIAELIDRTPGATREFLSQTRQKLRVLLAVCRDYLHGDGRAEETDR